MRKPRTKKQRNNLEKYCWYYDGVSNGEHIRECFYPWSHQCTGERHKCFKLKLRWLASIGNKKKRKAAQENYSQW